MTAVDVLLPGEVILPEKLPTSKSTAPLKIGPGLHHVPPSTITTTLSGSLQIDLKKNAIWVENAGGRYIPQINDLVLATVQRSSAELYHCIITPHSSYASLPHLAFEGATRKSRPQLNTGSLIYARISSATKHMDPELTCCNSSTGKNEGMGELKDGMVFDVSLSMARRLLLPRQKEDGGLILLEALAEQISFEIAIGRNGKVWVKGAGVRAIMAIGKALQDTDQEVLGVQEQERVVRKLLREV